MIRSLATFVSILFLAAPTAAPAAPAPESSVALWRLDCGEIQVNDLNAFSDTYQYVGRKKTLTASCYLIRHSSDYLLWDTGLAGELAGKPGTGDSEGLTLRSRVRDQLAAIGVKPEQIGRIGISHNHFDHIGQAADFPAATLLIGKEDLEAIRGQEDSAKRLAPWISGGSKAEPVTGDLDVFGDGSVVMLTMPGHTPGHHSLLVRLANKGPVLLSGDVIHFTENLQNDGVPSFNTNRADSLASLDRFKHIAANLHATIIIQHEPEDIAKLPAFPKAAD